MKWPTYHVATIGCQMNKADSRRAAAELERIGYRPASSSEDADVVVVNTCAVRKQAEDRIEGWLGDLKRMKRERRDKVVAVMGCMVGEGGVETESLRSRFPFVDLFLPPSQVAPLVRLLEAGFADRADGVGTGEERDWSLIPASRRGGQITAHVPVVLGCSCACAYCIIPARRGRERSRPLAEVAGEVRVLAEQGVREVTLLGQIVDRYGRDLEPKADLAELLTAIHDTEGIERIRFLTSHPRWMDERLLEVASSLPKVCPHFELPVQAGDDAVLRRMRRGYTTAQYRALVERIRALQPDASIHTDIIVGFPGESEAAFEGTLALAEAIRFDKIHMARYSPRPGTHAAEQMEDDVPDGEKRRRHRRLEDLQKAVQAERNRRFLGRVVPVLVEGSQKGRWWGRSPHNKLVYFPDERELLGAVVPVAVEWTGPYSLVGVPAAH